MIVPQLMRLRRVRTAALTRGVSAIASWSWATIRCGRARAALASVDRRTLADVGIGPGEITWSARDLGRIRRPPHV